MARRKSKLREKLGKAAKKSALWLARKSRAFKKPPLTETALAAVRQAVEGDGYDVLIEQDADFGIVRVQIALGIVLLAAANKERWAKQKCAAIIAALASAGVTDRDVSVHLVRHRTDGQVVYFGKAYYSSALKTIAWKQEV